jgi:lambda repressor-like predicted transcriptional regulator
VCQTGAKDPHKGEILDVRVEGREVYDAAKKFDENMKPDLAKHELLKFRLRHEKKLTLSEIAKRLNIKPGSVTAVSQGYRRSRRVEQALAEALDTSPEELFPDRKYERKKS